MRRLCLQRLDAAVLRGVGNEAQRRGVHTVAKPGRLRAVVEDVTEMRVAEFAAYGGAHHAEGGVPLLDDVLLSDGSPEAGPAGAGLELRI